MLNHQTLGPQSSTGKQVVELNGYVIIVVESRDGKIKLYGSPADKDNLEVGDEILDVNERKLEDLPRAEVIRYIHECIQSCVIKLRVKRCSARLAGELGNAVQDAFVIAVEQQARERLQRLSALKRITPVDMSQLSIKLNQQSQTKGATTQDYSFLKEASPIYVTSLTGNHVSGTTTITTATSITNNCVSVSNNNQQTSTTITPPTTVTSGQQYLNTNKIFPNNTITHQALINHNETGSGLSANNQVTLSSTNNQHFVNLNNNNNSNISNSGAGNSINKFHANSNNEQLANGHGPRRGLSTLSEGDSEPPDEPYHQLSISKVNNFLSSGGTEALLGDQSSWPDNRNRRRSSVNLNSLSEETIKSRLPFDDYLGHGEYHDESKKDAELEMLTMLSVNQDNGPHREMAVDVPESFIARNKTPPRYPPPRPPNQLNGSLRPIPPPRDHLHMEKDGRLVNRTPAPQVPDRRTNHIQNSQIAQILDPTSEQLDSIKKYQEQLRRRQEAQERILQQNDFRRASIRGSRKLQALQDSPLQDRPVGIENDAYAEDEEIEVIAGYGELVAGLQKLQNELNKQGLSGLASRVTAAQQLLSGPNIARALAIRTAVLLRRRPRIQPLCATVQTIAKDCVELLTQSNQPAAIELCELLSTYDMEGLLLAHDRIASTTDRTPAAFLHSSTDAFTNKIHNQSTNIINNNVLKQQREPISAPSLRDQDPIRIIQIEKSSDSLGATIVNEGDAVVIGRIVCGGAAEKSGLLHKNDEILEINGIEMSGKSINEVCQLLSSMVGTLTFLIVPGGAAPTSREPQILHVRAHFDYKPEDDMYIPCRELGISFTKGDVLHVISREDANWWQAYREGEEGATLAGLIPSQSFQHQRESMKLAIAGEAGLTGGRGKGSSKGSTLLCVKKSGKRKKKMHATSEAGYPLYSSTTPDDAEPEEILTYEEVSLYYPRASYKRPIVLIGPPNIGRHELRQRLMADSRFAAAVPHTSRTRRDGEVPGQDYHFISRSEFEADILARKFVEHGEYERAYYGTSLEAIRTVVSSGKICVLNLHPQSLKLLRASDLKPYVILVSPPSLDVLRQKKVRSGEAFKDEDLKDIIATARDMEARWGHLFDVIIINNDTERAYHKLLTEINSLEREPQWVPAKWLHN